MTYDMYLTDADLQDPDLQDPDAYFGHSMVGMRIFRQLMQATGMLYAPNPDIWVTALPSGTPEAIVDLAGDLEEGVIPLGATVDQIRRARAYNRHCEQLRRAHPTGGQTIPEFKVGCSDGWVITPDELSAALASYHHTPTGTRDRLLAHFLPEAADREYWDRWLIYLSRGVVHGGVTAW